MVDLAAGGLGVDGDGAPGVSGDGEWTKRCSAARVRSGVVDDPDCFLRRREEATVVLGVMATFER
jgi:hypothetical protein